MLMHQVLAVDFGAQSIMELLPVPSGPSSSTQSVLGGRCVVDLSDDALLGRGSFAVVRRALLHGETVCACKQYISDSSDDDYLEQFRAEVDMLRRLDTITPIVKLLAYSEPNDEQSILVAELGSRTLQEHVAAAKSSMTGSEFRSIAQQCCAALAALEELGLVVVDFKPSNIMAFPTVAHSELWKLIDADGFVAAGAQVGADDMTVTPVYCPPELARIYCEADTTIALPANSHCWNLGVTMLEMLAGGETWLQKRYSVCRSVHGEDADGIVVSFFAWLAKRDAQLERERDAAIAKAVTSSSDARLRALLLSLLHVDCAARVSAHRAAEHAYFDTTEDGPLDALLRCWEQLRRTKD